MIKPMKTCGNPECGVEYNNYKSSKSKHCCDECRWRAGYLIREERNKERNTHFKAVEKSEEIIDFLVKNGGSEFDKSTLKQVGFDFGLMYGKKLLDKDTVKFRLGKYEIRQVREKPNHYSFTKSKTT